MQVGGGENPGTVPRGREGHMALLWALGDRPETPPVYGVKGGGLYSITRLHGQLHLKPRWPLSAPRQAFVLVPSA